MNDISPTIARSAADALRRDAEQRLQWRQTVRDGLAGSSVTEWAWWDEREQRWIQWHRGVCDMAAWHHFSLGESSLAKPVRLGGAE